MQSFLPACSFILGLCIAACVLAEAPKSTPILIDKAALETARAKISQHDAAYERAYGALKDRAEQALKNTPPSVMDKTRTPPSGDKHDYMSIAPYWYANPETPDGLPPIHRDGERNPLARGKDYDRTSLENLSNAVVDLTLMYELSGEQKYAEQAARMLRTWYLDPATRMNPNMEFAQCIVGKSAGGSSGIIDTTGWVLLLDAVELLQASPAWRPEDHQALQKWFGQYADWLTASKLGKEEASRKNNHATWYELQVARYALFAGRPEAARATFERIKTKRIPEQMEPDGSMPLELARTKAFSYSVFNLRAHLYMARLAEHMGVDLWKFSTPDGRSLRKSLDFIAPYADSSVRWPHQQIGEENYRAVLQPVLRMAAAAYPDGRYGDLLAKFPSSDRDADIAFFTIALK